MVTRFPRCSKDSHYKPRGPEEAPCLTSFTLQMGMLTLEVPRRGPGLFVPLHHPAALFDSLDSTCLCRPQECWELPLQRKKDSSTPCQCASLLELWVWEDVSDTVVWPKKASTPENAMELEGKDWGMPKTVHQQPEARRMAQIPLRSLLRRDRPCQPLDLALWPPGR